MNATSPSSPCTTNSEPSPASVPATGSRSASSVPAPSPSAASPATPTDSKDTLIPIHLITVDRDRLHRIPFDTTDVESLANSIALVGLINPVILRPTGERFTLVAGHRRLEAHRRLHRDTIPATILQLDDDDEYFIKAAENLERRELSPIEEAIALNDAIEHDATDPAELGRRLTRSPAWINERLHLLDWPPDIQQALHHRKLSLAAGRNLAAITDDAARGLFLETAVRSGATAATTAAWLQSWRSSRSTTDEGPPPPTATQIIADRSVLYLDCHLCKTPTPADGIIRVTLCQSCARTMADAQANAAPNAQ